jgi:hypothetical protein
MGLASASTLGLSALLPRSMNRDAWLDLANKLGAYRLFASADRFLRDSKGAGGLISAIEQVGGLTDYSAVWATEGVGYYYARDGGQLCKQGIPRQMRLPMHTGAGLAWAEAAIRSAPESGIGQVLSEFWRDCVTAAQYGYHEALFEAVGLVAATLNPSLVSELVRNPETITEDQSALFWHGVGRGLYFSPIGFVPLAEARSRAFRLALGWPVSEAGRRNALAGLAWAITLVNVRDPEVVLFWLTEHADEIRRNEGFRNGVTSALIAWLASSQEDTYVEALGRFQPADLDPGLKELWRCTVGWACRDARRLHDADSSGDLAARVFRVRPLQI